MNPVDHVSPQQVCVDECKTLIFFAFSLTVVVTISILGRPRQYHGSQHKVKKQVLLQRGELVCYVVLRKRKIRHVKQFQTLVNNKAGDSTSDQVQLHWHTVGEVPIKEHLALSIIYA